MKLFLINAVLLMFGMLAVAGCSSDREPQTFEEDAFSPITTRNAQTRFFNVRIPEYRIAVQKHMPKEKTVRYQVQTYDEAGNEGINGWIYDTGIEILQDKQGDLTLITVTSPELGEHLAVMRGSKRLLTIKRNGDIGE